jgi:hypothetical protein
VIECRADENLHVENAQRLQIQALDEPVLPQRHNRIRHLVTRTGRQHDPPDAGDH